MTIKQLRFILLSFLFLSTAVVNAQIPNNGFEQWATDPSGNFNPTGWETTNDGTDISVEQVTPAKVGNFAMRVKTFDPGFMPINGIAMADFAFTQRPGYFSGWIKATVMPGDAVYVIVSMWKGDSIVASPDSCTFIIDSTITGYTRFTYPLLYQSGLVPDSANIMVIAGKAGVTSLGTEIILDELTFENEVGTEETMPEADPQTSAFPNPASEKIHFSITMEKASAVMVELYNQAGILVERYPFTVEGSGNQILEVSVQSLPDGMYLYRITGGDVRQSGVFNVRHTR